MRWVALAIGSIAGVLLLSGPALGQDSPRADRGPDVPKLQRVREVTGAPALEPVRNLTERTLRTVHSTVAIVSGTGASTRSEQLASASTAASSSRPRATAAPAALSGPPGSGGRGYQQTSGPSAQSGSARSEAVERRLRRLVERFSTCLGGLPELERVVLSLRTGIGRASAFSQRGVAERLEISRIRVGRAERRGLRLLRVRARSGACSSGGASAGPVPGGPTSSHTYLAAAHAPAGLGAAVAAATSEANGQSPLRDDRERALLEPDSIARVAERTAADSAYGIWLLAMIGLMVVTGLVLASGRQLPTVHLAYRMQPLRCRYCGGTRHAVNAGAGVHRCLDCGQHGHVEHVNE
jgi:sigma-70-like protein